MPTKLAARRRGPDDRVLRFARALLGVWLGACASSPAHDRPTPAADPAPAPAATHHATPDPVLRVLIGGDVIPHRPQLLDAASVGAALAPLSALFRSVDATVVNYETSTGDVGKIDAPLSLAASPAWMRAIAGANVTALTLANNHACDLGVRGLAASIVTAKSSGVIALGASEDDPWRAHTIASRDGRRVCAVAWTTFVNDRRPRCADSGRLAVAKPGRAETTPTTCPLAKETSTSRARSPLRFTMAAMP